MTIVEPERALTWRLGRHFLVGSGSASVEHVVERLVAVPATPMGSGDPELSIRLRLADDGRSGTVSDALAKGRLIKTFAFRGATHLMTPGQAAVHLAVRCAGRQWELASWRAHYRLEPDDWPVLRAVVRERASDGPVTWADLADAMSGVPRFAHLEAEFTGQNWTLLKPFMWQGDLGFGPTIDGVGTFQLLSANPDWPGVMPLDEAGPRAVMAYLDGYGPATADRLQYWLGAGLSAGRKRIAGWLAQVEPRLAHVQVDGQPALLRAEWLEDLRTARPDDSVVLLPGYDQWVLGPGTADEWVVPAELRPATTRGANLVLAGGRVGGTWKRSKDLLEVTWAGERPAPDAWLTAAGERWAALLGLPLSARGSTGSASPTLHRGAGR